MYERAFLVRTREDIDKREGAVEPSMVHEVDSPFSMDQIRTSIMDECPARERADLVWIRMEPDTRVTHPGLTKSDPIMIEPDIKASCAKGIPHIPTEGEAELPLDAQMQEMCQKDLLPEHRRWQRGCRPEVTREDSKVIQSELYGRCVVINGYMHPITDFVRGPLCKPPVEVQERAAFVSLWEAYDPDVYHSTIKSLEDDEIMQHHWTMVCIRIVHAMMWCLMKATIGGNRCGSSG